MASLAPTDTKIAQTQARAGVARHGTEAVPVPGSPLDGWDTGDLAVRRSTAAMPPVTGHDLAFPILEVKGCGVAGGTAISRRARRAEAIAVRARDREATLRAVLERERALALSLQATIFPRQLPKVPGYSLAAAYHAALRDAEVGGDFYDVFRLPDGRLGLLLGDVSGKGLSAAQTAAMARYTARAYAVQSGSPGDVLAQVNAALCGAMDGPERFVTAFYAVLDHETGTLRYAGAGHWPGLLITANGTETLGEGSLALGIDEAARYDEDARQLTPGDRFLLFTDGLVERAGEDPCRALDAVRTTLARSRRLSPEELVARLHEEALLRNGGALRDDVALLALHCHSRR